MYRYHISHDAHTPQEVCTHTRWQPTVEEANRDLESIAEPFELRRYSWDMSLVSLYLDGSDYGTARLVERTREAPGI